MNLLQPQRKANPVFPRKIACNRVLTASNQLWEIDIKYGFVTGEQRFFFLLSILDVYDRSIVDYHIGLSCESRHATQTIQRALLKRQQYEQKKLPVLRTDNGPQFISRLFGGFCGQTIWNTSVSHLVRPIKMPISNRFTALWSVSV
ncbi:DDE-type integrase/transposase/recombinase [Thermoactinomyces sp. DSM 45891]|uniref:DDE-type integrase/transposase/recombinase n=1 Tax=Thermoactinomyces sp. DSM 45891 TaxID=1761907 RepID=UPI000A7E8441|nr:DDE-type integrase/transposase/recombinase [Thermoactinomyces sp. DSM 45891]